MSRFPVWLKNSLPDKKKPAEMVSLLKELHLNTVCQSARCPNIGKCFSEKTATFMILGEVCSRRCRFCAVKKGSPAQIDTREPENIAHACKKLGIRHVVITSVTRDDLPDGGAQHFCNVIDAVRDLDTKIIIEILTPDFQGNQESLEKIVQAKPEIFNHNIETVPSLYKDIRPEADFKQSLGIIKKVKELNPKIYTKSGIMVGMGETEKEVYSTLSALRKAECDILTIGQYLQPTKDHHEVREYILPEVFEEYKDRALKLGFKYVASAPLVRSSFNALDFSKKFGLVDDESLKTCDCH